MAFVPSTISATSRGIAATLSGYIVQNETITETPVTEQIADQDGAIALEIDYDKRIDLRLTVIDADGNGSIGSIGENGLLTYASHTWKIDSVEEAGTYNAARRWNVTAHRYAKPATAVKTGYDSSGDAKAPSSGTSGGQSGGTSGGTSTPA